MSNLHKRTYFKASETVQNLSDIPEYLGSLRMRTDNVSN